MPLRPPSRWNVFAALAIVLAAPAVMATKPHHPPRHLANEQIEQMENQWRAAAMAGDTAAMDKLLSDDYLGITSNGDLLTKQQQLERMRTREFALTRLESSDLKIKLIGQIAIVTSLAEIDGTSDAKPVHGMFRYTRVYKHTSSGSWKVTSFEATRVPKGRQPAEQN